MIVIALDLELNKEDDKVTDIIQIGAVAGDTITGEILGEFNCYVRPKAPISPFISTLTGITDDIISAQGVEIVEAYNLFRIFCDGYDRFRNPCTWGGSDATLLREQAGISWDDFCFGYRHIDVKTIYQAYCIANNLPVRSGLKKSCGRLGLTFKGPAHDALNDARATFQVYFNLLGRFKR